MPIRNARVPAALICALLALPTLAVFWPVTHFEFVNLDDPDYVIANGVVRQGLTSKGRRWAVRTFHAANWHPLAWVSHMLDVQVFGGNPRPDHLTSLLFPISY